MEFTNYFTLLDNHPVDKHPSYKTKFSAGLDLYASNYEDIVIEKGEYKCIPLGIKLEKNDDFISDRLYFTLHIKSGVALKRGLTLLNNVGIIDADYKDEIKAIIYNVDDTQIIKRGDCLCQLIVNLMARYVGCVDNIERNGGFGSTEA